MVVRSLNFHGNGTAILELVNMRMFAPQPGTDNEVTSDDLLWIGVVYYP